MKKILLFISLGLVGIVNAAPPSGLGGTSLSGSGGTATVTSNSVANLGFAPTNTVYAEDTNVAYTVANQFAIPSWAEVAVNFQYTWNTNFANVGAAMIKTANTNYQLYVTTVTPGTAGSSNFFVRSGRVFYPTNDPTAKYIGFTCSNTPTRIAAMWRVFDQNRGAAVNWLQVVLACSPTPMLTAPGNAGINIVQAVHWTVTPDLAASAVNFTTSGVGTGHGLTLNPQLFDIAPNYATSPLGGRTTVGADIPDTGEIFIQEMIHTPAMGDTIQFHFRNQTYTTNDTFTSSRWGKSVMAEIFSPAGTYPVSANYELLAVWAGTKPEDLIVGNIDVTLGNVTIASNLIVSGNTTLSGLAKLNAPTNATTIVNLGLDVNGNISSNAIAIGGGTTYPSQVWTNGFSFIGVASNNITIDKFHFLIATNAVQIGSPATADNGQLLLYGTNGHLSRLNGINVNGVDQSGFSFTADSVIVAELSSNYFNLNASLIATNATDYIGLLNFPADTGGPLIDISITSSTAAGIAKGYTNRIDGIDILQQFGTSDGAGTVTNLQFVLPLGTASTRSNLLAPTSITAPATTVAWTNPISANIEVYIDNSGVTGTAIAKNGTTIFTSLVGDVTIGLQKGEYIMLTYSVGTPVIKWTPR